MNGWKTRISKQRVCSRSATIVEPHNSLGGYLFSPLPDAQRVWVRAETTGDCLENPDIWCAETQAEAHSPLSRHAEAASLNPTSFSCLPTKYTPLGFPRLCLLPTSKSDPSKKTLEWGSLHFILTAGIRMQKRKCVGTKVNFHFTIFTSSVAIVQLSPWIPLRTPATWSAISFGTCTNLQMTELHNIVKYLELMIFH